MPFQSIPPVITENTWTESSDGLHLINDALTGADINLTKTERRTPKNIGTKRRPYADAYFAVKDDYPKMKPQYMDEAKFVAHYQIFTKGAPLLNILTQVTEKLKDLQINSGYFIYEYLLEVYNNAGRAKERNVPGADTLYDMLHPLFANQGNESEEIPDDEADGDNEENNNG